MVTTLSPEERTLIAWPSASWWSRGDPWARRSPRGRWVGGCPRVCLRHLRSERMVGPLLDLMEVEPNPRTSRRRTQDLKAVIADWVALAKTQQPRELDRRTDAARFSKKFRVSERVHPATLSHYSFVLAS